MLADIVLESWTLILIKAFFIWLILLHGGFWLFFLIRTCYLSAGAVRKVGRNQVVPPQSKVVRTISVKDVIAVLEREPQMSKSTLMYRLYEKVQSDATA